MAPTRLVTPVEVSLCTTMTALMAWPLSAARLASIGAHLGLDRGRIGSGTPVARHEIDIDAPARRHLLPQRGEMTGLDHQHLVAGRQRVDDRCFSGTGAGRRKHENT